MNYSARATVAGAPKFELRAQAEPIGFSCGVEGAVRARIGPIQARVGRVPIVLAIPFLGGLQPIGAVGPFDLRTGPIDVGIEAFELRCEGVLGSESLTCGLEGTVDCKWKVDLHGTVPGRVTRASLEFADSDEIELEP
jgi:hypothetical protein